MSLESPTYPCLILCTMKKMILLMMLLCSCALIAQPAPKASPTPIRSLEWLVGGVWTADISMMGNSMKTIETRYSWSDNGSFIRFNTHFVGEKSTAKTYDGNLFYDSNRKSLQIWYMDAANMIVEGPMKVEGNHWSVDFRGTDFEGKMADLHVEVTRKSNALYHWALSERDADKWKPLAALDYTRTLN
jgi:hypothetical protein